MSEVSPEVVNLDTPEGLQLVMLMRIYDVLMTQLRFDHGETISDNLLELHAQGALLNPPPFFNGVFVYEGLNQTEESDEQ